MRRAPKVGYLLLTGLLISAILAGRAGHAIEPRRGGPTDDEKRTAKDDHQILEVVLLDLLDFKDFAPSGDAERKKTEIILGVKTAGSSGFLSDDQLNGESHGEKPHLIPPDIRADLRERNPNEPIALDGFRPKSKKIVVGDLGESTQFGDFEKKYPDARGYVETWLPGYSKDGNSAVLRATFGPTAHGATVTYMLVKRDGRWTVTWRKVARYA